MLNWPLTGPNSEWIRSAAAVPAGARRARDQGAWLRALRGCAELAGMRRDTRATYLLVLTLVCWHASHTTRVSRPGWDTLIARSGKARATVARALAWGREHGWLGHVERGTTERYRPGPDDGQGNLAAVYVLTIPTARTRPTAEHETPTCSIPNNETPAYAGARENRAPLRGAGDKTSHDGQPWAPRRVPSRRTERLAAADTAKTLNPVLRQLSARHVASCARDFFRAGWNVYDLLYALDHQSDGTSWPYAYRTDQLRHPGGWIRFRLRAWRDDHGVPIPSRSQQLRRAHAAQLEEQRTTRERARTAAARAADASSPGRVAARALAAAIGHRIGGHAAAQRRASLDRMH